LNELSLFTGAGGGLLATQHLLGFNTIGYVEIDDYCQRVIAQRIKDGFLHNAPIFTDIRAFINSGCAELYRGVTDLITAGFPCQPFSVEGKRQWRNDNRNKWPDTKRTIQEVKPKFVLLENVPGIQKYMPVVIRDLRRVGYTVKRPRAKSAANSGFLHKRLRLWIFAYNNSNGWEWVWHKFRTPAGKRLQTWTEFERLVQDVLQSCVPSRGGNGIHDGVANRVDRLKAIGNGQVPEVATTAWKTLFF